MDIPSAIDISQGLNASLGFAALLVFLASFWLYFRGDWRRHPEASARRNASAFIRGVCLAAFSSWISRSFWFWINYIADGDGISYRALWEMGVPLLIFAKIIGIIGMVEMLYPLASRYTRHVSWPLLAFFLFLGLFFIGLHFS